MAAQRRSDFFKPTVHIGWIVGLIIAIAGQLIVMYSKLSELEATKGQAHEFRDRELDQIQLQLQELRNKTCPTK